MLISSRPPRLIIPCLDVPKRPFHCFRKIRRLQTTTRNVAEQAWRAPNRGKRTQTAFKFQEPRPTSVPVESSIPDKGKEAKVAPDLHDLLQHPAPLQPITSGHETPPYPTVILQARNNMRKFENCILLTRVGGFYEMYFEQAEQYGPQLNLKVGEKKTAAGPVPMVRAFNTSPKPH